MERLDRFKEFILSKAEAFGKLADKVKLKQDNITQEDKDLLLPYYKEFYLEERD